MSKPPRKVRHSYHGIEPIDYVTSVAAWVIFFLSLCVPADTAIYFVCASAGVALFTVTKLVQRL